MKQYLNWDDITRLSNCVAEKIKAEYPDLSQVTLVGVSRGGLIPTQLIAYKLDIRDVRVVKLVSYDDNNERGEIKDVSTDELIDGKNVYIIDDLADSGATLKYLRSRFPEAKVCTLLKKTCCREDPDICIENGVSADTWIVFPWD